MTLSNARFRKPRTSCAAAICCVAFLYSLPALFAEPQSPADALHEIDPGGPRLGGENSLSPALVPHSILSLDLDHDAVPHARADAAQTGDESGEADDAAMARESLVTGEPLRVAQAEDRSESSYGFQDAERYPAVPLSPAELQTRTRVRNVLAAYRSWQLNSRDHSPWEVMHAIIAGGVSTKILQDGPGGTPVTAVGWLCFNRPAAGRRLFYPSRDGFGTLQGPGLEGHRGQLLAILAQARVKPDYPIQINGRSFTIADLIEYEKRTCYPRTELTFKLIALNHYLEQEDQWENDRGEPWNLPRLIREEITQPIRGATCGGTHRLAGLSLAVKKRTASGQPLDGEYGRAAKYIHDYHAYTFRLQNRDGSFSTQWFGGRGADPDPARRLQTTGHILEWLCYSLSEPEMRDPRVRAAADYLAGLMWEHRQRTWDNGPLGHALHALVLYDERVFQPHDVTADQLSAAPQGSGSSGLPR